MQPSAAPKKTEILETHSRGEPPTFQFFFHPSPQLVAPPPLSFMQSGRTAERAGRISNSEPPEVPQE
jgi:hypothetical protein